METQDDILIFKTNVRTAPDKQQISEIFKQNPSIHQWNVDADDCDCVLRIVSREVKAIDIIRLLTEKGYLCQELE